MDIILDKMLSAMEEASGYTKDQLLSRDRSGQSLCPCRYFIWYHLHYNRKWSLSKIGREFSRDHATVYTGIQKVDGVMIGNPCYRKEQAIYDKFINNLIEEL